MCTAALGMEYARAPVQFLCQDVLSSPWKEKEKRERKGLGVGEPHCTNALEHKELLLSQGIQT